MALQIGALHLDQQTDIEVRDKILCIAFHPVLPVLVVGTSISKIKVYDIVSNNLIHVLVKVGKVISVTFSSDGRYLASSHAAEPFQVKSIPHPITRELECPYKICLWNVHDSFRFVKDSDSIGLHDSAPIHTVEFCSSVIYQQQEIIEKDTGKFDHRRSFSKKFDEHEKKKKLFAVRTSLIATGDGDGQMRLWDYARNKKWSVVRQHWGTRRNGSCDAISFTTNGDFLAAIFNGLGEDHNEHVLCVWRVNHQRKADRKKHGKGNARQKKTVFLVQYELSNPSIQPVTAMKFFPSRFGNIKTSTNLIDDEINNVNNSNNNNQNNNNNNSNNDHNSPKKALNRQDSNVSDTTSARGRRLSRDFDTFSQLDQPHSQAPARSDTIRSDEQASEFGNVDNTNFDVGDEIHDVQRIAIGSGTSLVILLLKKTLATLDADAVEDIVVNDEEDNEAIENRKKKRSERQKATEKLLQNEYTLETLVTADHDSHITSLDIDKSGYYVLTGEQLPQTTHNDHGVGLWTVVGDAVTYSFLGSHDRDVMDVSIGASQMIKTLINQGAFFNPWERMVASASLDETVRIFIIDYRYGRLSKNRPVVMIERKPTVLQLERFKNLKAEVSRRKDVGFVTDMIDSDQKIVNYENLDVQEHLVSGKTKNYSDNNINNTIKNNENNKSKQDEHRKIVKAAKERSEMMSSLKPGQKYLMTEMMPLLSTPNTSGGLGGGSLKPKKKKRAPQKRSKLLMTFEKFARNTETVNRKKQAENSTRRSCRNCISFL